MPGKFEKTRKKTGAGRLVSRILLIVLISIFLGSTVYTINAKRVLHNEMPMPLGVGLSVVLSGSMEPTLSVNDLILVRATDDIQENDVIVYQSGSDLVVHRVISMDGETVTTKGDANNTADDPVKRSAVKGKVVFSLPYVGIAVQLLQTTVAKLLIILLAVYLLHRSWVSQKAEDNAELDAIKAEIRKLKAIQQARTADDPQGSAAAAEQSDPNSDS